MEVYEYVLLIVSSLLSVVSVIYEVIRLCEIKNQNKESVEGLYFKEQSFEKAKNSGDDPCDIKVPFELPVFSQECEYFVLK